MASSRSSESMGEVLGRSQGFCTPMEEARRDVQEDPRESQRGPKGTQEATKPPWRRAKKCTYLKMCVFESVEKPHVFIPKIAIQRSNIKLGELHVDSCWVHVWVHVGAFGAMTGHAGIIKSLKSMGEVLGLSRESCTPMEEARSSPE